MGWLHKLHIPSFTLHTSYCLLLLPDSVYLRSNAMCHKQPWRPKPSIHSKHKISAVATPACSLPPSPKPIHSEQPFQEKGGGQLSVQLIQSLTLCQYRHQLQVLLCPQLIVQGKAQITKSLAEKC